jgi:hypothetical protein
MLVTNAKMKWKVKCLAFYAMHYAPAGDKIHAWVQMRITRRYFPKFTQEFINGYLFNVRTCQELQSDSARHIIPPGSIEQVQEIPVADCFRGYSKEDLAGLNGLFLLER